MPWRVLGHTATLPGMHAFVAGSVVLGAFVFVNIIGVVAFLAAWKLALYLDPLANESHFSSFNVAIIGVAMAVASAFPIFGRGVPWVAERLQQIWAERPPERPFC
jgi:hypothetical protein